jgi:hypothetical protein
LKEPRRTAARHFANLKDGSRNNFDLKTLQTSRGYYITGRAPSYTWALKNTGIQPKALELL